MITATASRMERKRLITANLAIIIMFLVYILFNLWISLPRFVLPHEYKYPMNKDTYAPESTVYM